MAKTLAELRESKAVQHGALLVFNQDVSPERIAQWVNQLKEKGVLESGGVYDFNPDWGGPVWYVP